MSVTSWHEIASLANKSGAKFPELCAAQWALESSWGSLPTGTNNFFGIKGKGTKKKTLEYVNGKEVEIVDEFMNFATPEECVKYLVDRWYKDYAGRYKGVNNAATRNKAAEMLVTEGYCTDPSYAAKLIKIMDNNTAPSKGQSMSTELKSTMDLNSAVEYDKRLPHQIEAWKLLQSMLTKEQLSKFFAAYRKPAQKPTILRKFPLSVPYFYQRDSKTGHGERSCQSSAIAMVIKYFKPSAILDDDDYLNLVLRYGDTVAQSAHCKALSQLGFKYEFKMNGSEKDLIKILDGGCPIPIGILHKGSISNPSGGGHYITLIGYDDKYFYVHDPFGELDLQNGGYPKAGPIDGRMQKYTRKNLMKRWLVQNDSDGWFWDLRGNS
jgi:hypothetical protein